MTRHNNQTHEWAGDEGIDYTDRNPHSVPEMNELRTQAYGVTQRELNERFLDGLPRDLRILEVGTNMGIQLKILEDMGFEQIYGIDVSKYALSKGRKQYSGVNFIEGSALDIPFDDDCFDLVFTIGVLVAIPPAQIETAMDEIVRCSNRYVWGLEFYADEYTKIEHRDLYWKTDFVDLYRRNYPLEVVNVERLEYVNEDQEDRMYLLEQTDTDNPENKNTGHYSECERISSSNTTRSFRSRSVRNSSV